MTIIHSNRTMRYYMTLLLVILMHFLVLIGTDLSAKEKASGFLFNPQSEYWPTKGWKTSTPERQGMSSEVLAGTFEEIEKFNTKIDSLLVVRNGYIVLEANKRYVATLYPIYSSTKSVTSALFGIALSKGYIKSIDQPVTSFFPELLQKNDDSRKAAITLKHLLTMSCGFEWPEVQTGYINPDNPVRQMMISENWVKFILNKPVTQQPGLMFNYNSGCSHLLSAVLNQTGLNVEDFAQQTLFAPLGISTVHYLWGKDPNGIPNGSHGLIMRSHDMAKVGYLYLKGGYWERKQIIPKSWIEESTKKQIEMTWGGFLADHYGYQWYIQPFGFHSLGHQGQYIFVIPKLELVAVFTSSLPGRQIAIPIQLVKTYIISAVKDLKPLPENEKAITALESNIKRFNDK
jgi:CubicO group peptidase (beta-lactamase class C family)